MPHEGTSKKPTVENRQGTLIPTHRWMKNETDPLPSVNHTDLSAATVAVAGEDYGTVENVSNPRVPTEVTRPILAAVQLIAERCDGAHNKDLQGFNAGDTTFGKALAFVPVEEWEPETAWAAHRMLKKYRAQLAELGVPYDSLPVPERPASTDSDAEVGKHGRQLVRDPYSAHVKEQKRVEREAEKEQRKAERNTTKQQQREQELVGARKITDHSTGGFAVYMDRRDRDAREALKNDVPGRRFDWDTNIWVVPASSVSELAAYAQQWQFSFDATLKTKFEEEAKKLDELKEDPNYAKKQNGTVTVDPVTGKLIIYTPAYNPSFVSEVQNLAGRKWDGKNNIVNPTPEALAVAERYGLHIPEDISGLVKEKVVDEERLTALSYAHDADLHIEGFNADLYGYQKAGIAYALEAKRILLGDQMGLGKSRQAVGTIHAADAYPAVVVCTASLKHNWKREFDQAVDGKNIVVVDGRSPVDFSGADVVVLNYDILQHHLGALQELGPQSAVFDESHYVKNQKAGRTVAALALADTIPNDGYVLALSGTPVTNRTAEFVSQLQLLGKLEEIAPNPSNPVGSFLFRYCDPVPTGYQNTYTYKGASNSEELQTKLRSRCYVRRQKEDVLKDLPKKTRQTTLIDMDEKADGFKEYKAAEKDFATFVADRLVKDLREKHRAENIANASEDDEYPDISVDDIIDALDGTNDKYRNMGFNNKGEFDAWSRARIKAAAGETLTKAAVLRQAIGKAKIPLAIERIDEFRESTGRKMVVFAHHREVVDTLAEHYGAPKISGSVNAVDRQKAVDAFQNDPNTPIIVCNDKAAAEGITLTAASDVLMVEQDWIPMDQAEARVDRIGQTQPVTIHYLVAADTIDEKIHALVEKKRLVVNAATDGVPITNSDDSDLDAIFNVVGI
jgi:hypothetical protein